jgi:hypothetical protein
MPKQPQESSAKSLCIAIAAKGSVPLAAILEALSREAIERVSLHIVHDREIDWQTELAAYPKLSTDPQAGQLKVMATRLPEHTSILRHWGVGLAPAETDYVAALDAHCPPTTDWLSVALEQIDRGEHIFCGPVNSGWPGQDRRIIGYLVEYAQFMAPVRCQGEFPGNNIVLRRELLGPRQTLRMDGFFKTFLTWRLKREKGLVPSYFDAMAVEYKKPFSLVAYLCRRRDHGRCFAARRFEQADQPSRLACILFTPLLGFLRCLRIRRGLVHQPMLRKSFARHLPIILIAETAWALGEFLGYCFGDGGTCERLD